MKNTLLQKIEQKREELQSLQELRKYTGALADQLEQIEQKLDTMAEGAESIALILSSWQSVVGSVSLASMGLLKHAEKGLDAQQPLPETLVRIALNKDDNQLELP